MSRWLPDRLRASHTQRIAVDAHGFACVIDGKLRTGGHAEMATGLSSIKPGSTVEVIACSDLAVHWLQQVPRSLASLAELRQAAAARCAQLFGGKPAEWNVEGDWHIDREFVCAAVPLAFVARIEEALEPLSLCLRWRTGPTLALEQSADGWTAMRCASTLALWHAAAGRVDSITVMRIEDDVHASAKRHVVLEQARRGIGDSDEIRWLEADGGSESEAEATLAFCVSRASSRRASVASAAALLVGAVALVVVGVQVRQDTNALAEAQSQLSQMRAMPVPVPAQQRTTAAMQQRRAIDRITRQLNTPWSQLLDALEASLPDEAAIVSIEPDGAAGKVRLQSEARKLDTLIAYAAELRNVSMFSQVVLLKHETNDQDANHPIRMTMEVELASTHAEGSGTR